MSLTNLLSKQTKKFNLGSAATRQSPELKKKNRISGLQPENKTARRASLETAKKYAGQAQRARQSKKGIYESTNSSMSQDPRVLLHV